MRTYLRTIVWVGLLVVVAWPAAAQTPMLRRGVPLFFDHDEQSIQITEKYQLCQDDLVTCQDIPVVRLQGSLTFQFALPNWVANGAHIYAVRAYGDGQWSDPSNALTALITGKPLPPTNHRNTPPPSPTGTTSPPSAPSATLQTTLPSTGGALRVKP